MVAVAGGACMPSSGWACREGGAVEALPIPIRRRGRMSYFVGLERRETANTQHGLAVGACRLERGGRQGERSRRSSPCAPPNFNINAEDVVYALSHLRAQEQLSFFGERNVEVCKLIQAKSSRR